MLFSSELFWQAKIDELEQGFIYVEEKELYICLLCGKFYEKGIVYSSADQYYTAEKMVKQHIEDEHGSVFQALIDMDKKYTGLSDIQKEVLQLFYQGMDDGNIAQELGNKKSTIRNHRFRLKEKAKQARVFLAIMNLMESRLNEEDQIIDVHKNAQMVDDRYAITKAEKEEIIGKFFDEDGVLTRFPGKEKERLVVLIKIMERFEFGFTYTEKEMNQLIQESFEDYALIRRYLIEYGFLDRKADGSCYWAVF